MAGTFSQIYIHVVFAVSQRAALIQSSWEESLYRYITGIVTNKAQKMIAINGMPDHIHFVIGMKPLCCHSDLVREIKKSSNSFINDNQLFSFKFLWQEGFGTFSYGQSQLDAVAQYVLNQKTHHQSQSFREEYLSMLHAFKIEHNPKFLFDFID